MGFFTTVGGAALISSAGSLLSGSKNREFARSQRDYQARREDTAIQRRAADMKAAGINPLLAVPQGARVVDPRLLHLLDRPSVPLDRGTCRIPPVAVEAPPIEGHLGDPKDHQAISPPGRFLPSERAGSLGCFHPTHRLPDVPAAVLDGAIRLAGLGAMATCHLVGFEQGVPLGGIEVSSRPVSTLQPDLPFT